MRVSSKSKVQPRIMVLVPTSFPSASSISQVVSSLFGVMFNREAKEVDTKILSAPESNKNFSKMVVKCERTRDYIEVLLSISFS